MENEEVLSHGFKAKSTFARCPGFKALRFLRPSQRETLHYHHAMEQ